MRASTDGGGSAARPTAWWILGFASDPTPGDPFTAALLSSQMSGVATGASESVRGVRSLLGDPAITGWVGASGDAFRAACEPFPDQLSKMHESYQEAADALDAFNAAATSAQGSADSAYYTAHYAAQSVGLDDDHFHSAAGAEGGGYAYTVKQVLLAKQNAEATPKPVGAPVPSPTPGGAPPTAPDPNQLQGPFEAALASMVVAQTSAIAAKAAYDAAVTKCVDALERASDASFTGASWGGANGGTFDQRYATFGGDPAQLHFNGAGFDASEAAADARAWQQAKQNPNDPANQAIINDIKASLAAHLNDPEYIKGFADATPEDVTAFQGLPAKDADALNRAKLAEDVQDPNCPQSLKDLYRRLTDVQDKFHYDPDMLLLGFDTKGKGHAAVSYGDPDFAPNTAVYVPGTTSTLGGASGDLNRAKALFDQVPRGQMASIYWLGYDAPDWPSPIGSDNDYGPANQKYADAGAPQLAAFVNALNAQHQGATNVTMIGHSYGSTVVGDALANYGLHAQGAIFVGSPGVVASTADGLHLDPGHVWASKMKFDPVPSVSATLNPLQWDDDHTLRFGNDPTSSSFGGRTFDSDDGSDVMHAHSNYWKADGPGLGNMANLVTGHFDGIHPMSQDAKNGAVDFSNPLTFGGSVMQNTGHAMGDWGAPIEHLGDSQQSFGRLVDTSIGAAGDLISGDFSGAGHQISDAPGQAWNGVKDIGRSVGDLFSW